MGGNRATTIPRYVGVQHYTTFGSSFLGFSEGISYEVYLAHPLHQNKLHFNLDLLTSFSGMTFVPTSQSLSPKGRLRRPTTPDDNPARLWIALVVDPSSFRDHPTVGRYDHPQQISLHPPGK